MKNWKVFLFDCVDYHNIETETKAEAIQIALEQWSKRIPKFIVCDELEEELKEGEEKDKYTYEDLGHNWY